ncbi:hypothetical protein N7527_003962 [Penicillium freii]|nr:hypothetical protein N7527_003962 [Penicillium freii]
MSTRLRNRESARDTSSQEICEEACFIMQSTEVVLEMADTHQIATPGIIHAMVVRMKVLIQEMAELWYERVHHSRILSSIWD